MTCIPVYIHYTAIIVMANSFFWPEYTFKANERIEYKLLSLTYKVLTTSQPILTILSLFNPLTVPVPHLLSVISFSPTNHLLIDKKLSCRKDRAMLGVIENFA